MLISLGTSLSDHCKHFKSSQMFLLLPSKFSSRLTLLERFPLNSIEPRDVSQFPNSSHLLLQKCIQEGTIDSIDIISFTTFFPEIKFLYGVILFLGSPSHQRSDHYKMNTIFLLLVFIVLII